MRAVKAMSIWVVMAAMILAAGCEDDDSSLVNRWERHVIDDRGQAFDAVIVFQSDGGMRFEMLSPVSGHTETLLKYRTEGDRVVAYDDPECGTEGRYHYEISGSRLTLTVEEDGCAPRLAILHAEWRKR